MTELLPLDEARRIVLSHMDPLETETVDLLDAAGRIAAQDLVCDIDNAPFASTAMDGFAVRASQLEGASEEHPVELDVLDEVAAGDYYEGDFAEGQCLRIMTGAPVPACADSVVKYEIVDVVSGEGKPGGRVSFSAPTKLGSNVRKPGQDAKAGETVVHAGELVNSAGVGFLASCGVTKVPTYRRPKVAIMATGSELVEASEVPVKAQIRNSNSPALAACVRDAGGIPTILPIVKDTYDDLAEAVSKAVADYDFVITTGGAANGDFDFIGRVVADLGEVYLTHVNMRPGKAQTFGTVEGVPVFGLPGNPAAAYMGFQLLVRPALRKMQGYSHLDRVHVQAKLARDVRASHDSRMNLVRAIIELDDAGERIVTPFKNQGSSLFGPLQRSNAIVVFPRGDVAHAAGEPVDCLILDIPEEVVL
jgi:molybdopterin molybdotransferase